MTKKFDSSRTIQEYELDRPRSAEHQSPSPPPVEFPRFALQGTLGSSTPSSVNTRDLLAVERNLMGIGTMVNQHSDVLEKVQESLIRFQDRLGQQERDVVRIDGSLSRACEDTAKFSSMAVVSDRVDALQRWKTFLVSTSVVLFISFLGTLGLAGKLIWDASSGNARLTELSTRVVIADQGLKLLEDTSRDLERRLDKIGPSKSGGDFMDLVSGMTKEQEHVIMLLLCPPESLVPTKRSPSR